jgi:hypothetical protein
MLIGRTRSIGEEEETKERDKKNELVHFHTGSTCQIRDSDEILGSAVASLPINPKVVLGCLQPCSLD